MIHDYEEEGSLVINPSLLSPFRAICVYLHFSLNRFSFRFKFLGV